MLHNWQQRKRPGEEGQEEGQANPALRPFYAKIARDVDGFIFSPDLEALGFKFDSKTAEISGDSFYFYSVCEIGEYSKCGIAKFGISETELEMSNKASYLRIGPHLLLHGSLPLYEGGTFPHRVIPQSETSGGAHIVTQRARVNFIIMEKYDNNLNNLASTNARFWSEINSLYEKQRKYNFLHGNLRTEKIVFKISKGLITDTRFIGFSRSKQLSMVGCGNKLLDLDWIVSLYSLHYGFTITKATTIGRMLQDEGGRFDESLLRSFVEKILRNYKNANSELTQYFYGDEIETPYTFPSFRDALMLSDAGPAVIDEIEST